MFVSSPQEGKFDKRKTRGVILTGYGFEIAVVEWGEKRKEKTPSETQDAIGECC